MQNPAAINLASRRIIQQVQGGNPVIKHRLAQILAQALLNLSPKNKGFAV
jgi:hypothetical protein